MNRPSIVLSLVLVLLCTLGTACDVAPAPASPPVTTATSTPSRGNANGVAIRVSSASNKFTPGASAILNLTFEPVIQSVTRRSDGSILAVSQQLWPNAPVAEMKYCIAPNTPCTPEDTWMPFVTKMQAEVAVNWVGERDLWVVAQFRDASGGAIPGIDENQGAGPQARANTRLLGIIDERTPDAAQAPSVQTLIAKTRVAFPVKGSVEIAGGKCCVGGKVGTKVDIPVKFDAQSPAGQVTEMRVSNQCPREGEGLTATWEPFTAQKTYNTTTAINFVGWYIAVQYRDARGNLSPVYCDDISVEGSP